MKDDSELQEKEELIQRSIMKIISKKYWPCSQLSKKSFRNRTIGTLIWITAIRNQGSINYVIIMIQVKSMMNNMKTKQKTNW